MNTKEIKDLLKLVSELDLREVKIKDKDFELRIRTDKDVPTTVVGTPAVLPPVAPSIPVAQAPAPAATSEPAPAEAKDAEDSGNYIEVNSPMVGTFYRSSSPDKDAYVQVGDKVSKGDVLCIIEAMKLFNEIESEVSGTIVKVMVDDSSPVEYGQVLFLVEQ